MKEYSSQPTLTTFTTAHGEMRTHRPAGNSAPGVAVQPCMKAITYSEYGNPDVLELPEQPMPKVGPDGPVQGKAASVKPGRLEDNGRYLDAAWTCSSRRFPGGMWPASSIRGHRRAALPARGGSDFLRPEGLVHAAASPNTLPCRSGSLPASRHPWVERVRRSSPGGF